jgi:predicted Zn-dependent protease
MDEKQAKKICDKLLKFTDADEAEVLFHETSSALTRFANNQIEQNVSEAVADVTFRGVWGKRTARVTTSRFDDAALKRVADKTKEIASVQKDNPELLNIPEPQKYEKIEHFCEKTAFFTPEDRAEAVARHIKPVKAKKLTAAGIYETGFDSVAVANSKGLWAFDFFTKATFSTQVMGGVGSGFANAIQTKTEDIDIDALTLRAIDKCVSSEKPKAIKPGEYTVILEPDAVSNLLMFTSWLAFNALSYIEKRSPMTGKLGQKVFGDKITIKDDAYAKLSSGVPFDFEGMPRKRLTLVEKGVLKNLAHDRRTAKMMGVETTGHALPQPNPSGPYAMNLNIAPGKDSPEKIIKSTKNGVLVTQFHYTNVVNPMQLSITGMTRNGTFMIENGEIAYAVKNMRFTESVIKALSNVSAIGNDPTCASSTFGGGYVVPTLRIEKFTFSSGTEF